MRALLPLATVFAVLVMSACGGGDGAPIRSQASPFGTITVAQGTNRLNIDPPRRQPPRALRIKDLEVGTGPVVHRGDRVAVYYKGVDYETGKRVADTWPPGRPLELRLGFTGWGDEWEEGIEGMRVGGRRELIVPFPEGRVVDYVVDLVQPRPPQETTPTTQEKERYPLPRALPGKEPLEKLIIKDLEVGKGPEARWGDEAMVRYVGVYWRSGYVFAPHWSYASGFELDGEEIGIGWQKGLHGMRVGGRRELLIPGSLLLSGEKDIAYIVALDKVKPGAAN